MVINILKRLFGKGSSANLPTTKQGTPYQQLIHAAKIDPDSVDFTELRLAYADSPEYDPYDTKGNMISAGLEFGDALERDDPRQIVILSEKLLARAPLFMWAHVQAEYNYVRLGEEKKAAYHHKFVNHWWDSLFLSGDGRSFQTAFVVINLNEEYTTLYLLDAQQGKKRFEEKAGHFYDVWDVRNPKTGGKAEIYFNIDLIIKGVQEGRAQFPSDADVKIISEYWSLHPHE